MLKNVCGCKVVEGQGGGKRPGGCEEPMGDRSQELYDSYGPCNTLEGGAASRPQIQDQIATGTLEQATSLCVDFGCGVPLSAIAPPPLKSARYRRPPTTGTAPYAQVRGVDMNTITKARISAFVSQNDYIIFSHLNLLSCFYDNIKDIN